MTWRLVLLLLASQLSALSSQLFAAEVYGQLLNANSTPYTNEVLFRALSTPLNANPRIIAGGDFRVTPDTNGNFTLQLQAGDYRVFTRLDSKGFIISVPDGTNSYLINSRVTSALTYTPAAMVLGSATNVPKAAASTAGLVRTDSTVLDPQVYLAPTVDTLLDRRIISVGTVAALTNLNPSSEADGREFRTSGFRERGDGGGASYRYDAADTTSTDDGVFVRVTSSGKRLKLIHAGTINALQAGVTRSTGEGLGLYGAIRNGTNAIGTGDFSWFVEFINPTWTATQFGIAEMTDQTNGYARSAGLYGASGYLSILLRATNGSSGIASGAASAFLGSNPFAALSAGTTQRMVVTRSGGTLKVYINGADVTGSFSFVSGINNWSGANLIQGSLARYHIGYTFAGPFVLPSPVVRHKVWTRVLSPSEAADPVGSSGAVSDFLGSATLVTDSGPLLNLIGAKLKELGGGTIILPAGKILIETPIRVFAKVAIQGVPGSPAFSPSGMSYSSQLVSYNLTNQVVLFDVNDATDEVNLTPRDYNGETVYNRNHGGALRNVAVVAYGPADAIRLNQVSQVTIESVSPNTYTGRSLSAWACNGITINKMSGIGGSFTRGILLDFTADCILSDHNYGGGSGPIAWIRGNALSVANCQWWNTVPQTTFRKTATFSGSNITVTGHLFRTGDLVTFESSGTLPTPLDPITAYYVQVVDANTIRVNSARGALFAGTALSLSGGSGTLTVGPGPVTNVLLDNTLGNSFVGCRFDQSIAHSMILWNATEPSFSGCQFIDSWWAASASGMPARRPAILIRGQFVRERARFDNGCSFAAIRAPGFYSGAALSWCNQDVEDESPQTPSTYNGRPDVTLNTRNGSLNFAGAGNTNRLDPFVDFEIPAITIATRSRTSGTATIVTSFPHNLSTGSLVTVASSTDTSFNTSADVSITVVDALTFTYASAGGDLSATADTSLRVHPIRYIHWGGESATGREYRFQLGGGGGNRTLRQAPELWDVVQTSDGTGAKLSLQPSGGTIQFGSSDYVGPAALYTFGGAGTGSYQAIFGNGSSTAGRVRLDFGGSSNNRTTILGGTELAVVPNAGGTANLILQGSTGLGGTVSVGVASADASAILRVDATNRGLLPPRMTQAQRNAIASPAEGLEMVQTDATPGPKSIVGSRWHRVLTSFDEPGAWTAQKPYRWVFQPPNIATVSRARSSNVATIVTATPHLLESGNSVQISGLGGTGYASGVASVTVVNSTTFTYASTGSDEGTTADTGGLVSPQVELVVGSTGPTSSGFSVLVGNGNHNRKMTVQGAILETTQVSGVATPLMVNGTSGGGLVVGGFSIDAAAALQVDATNKVVLPPRMTKAQRNAISSPPNGGIIYQTDNTPGIRFYDNGAWVKPTTTADP